ncbi:metallophosphoesterase family protein [Streptomyces monticola]|uniref:Metallophosphoesterase family protein n=1 Tax=Streptomyces monticola TaxID=2666263 RepID=A0ABW2JXR4_9ACTN
MPDGKLWAISDLHVAFPENRMIAEALKPESEDDWLVIAGDVAESAADVEWALNLLSERYAKVVWAPGNHELWTPRDDTCQLRGEARYQHLVDICRKAGVSTPEDPYPVWTGAGGPVAVAPLFLLYDYSFRADGITSKEESLKRAFESGVVCSDEFLLHPDPYPGRDDWCRARVEATEARLQGRSLAQPPLILVNHYPLVRQPTRILHYQEFAQWCGTDLTADWHIRFPVRVMIYGHLHIPRTTWYDGVRFEEVSVGYPREWKRPGHPKIGPRQILPELPKTPVAPDGLPDITA